MLIGIFNQQGTELASLPRYPLLAMHHDFSPLHFRLNRETADIDPTRLRLSQEQPIDETEKGLRSKAWPFDCRHQYPTLRQADETKPRERQVGNKWDVRVSRGETHYAKRTWTLEAGRPLQSKQWLTEPTTLTPFGLRGWLSGLSGQHPIYVDHMKNLQKLSMFFWQIKEAFE